MSDDYEMPAIVRSAEAARAFGLRTRATHLHVTEQRLLIDWGCAVRRMFNNEMPYLVGSVLTTREYRDVDVRLMLSPADFLALGNVVNLLDLNTAVSLWGQRVTGLPIDFQVQDRDVANASEPGAGRRSAIGIAWTYGR